MPRNEITTVIKVKLRVPDEAAKILDHHSRICNWLYNQFLQVAIKSLRQFITIGDRDAAELIYSEYGIRNLIPQFKADHPFLKVVYSANLKNTALQLRSAIKVHKTSKKKMKKVGWPKFRSWKRKWFSLLYDEPNTGYKILGNTLQLALGMGEDRKRRSVEVKLEDATIMQGQNIRNLRIVKQLDVFYAVFTVVKFIPEAKTIKTVIALDPNHKNFFSGFATTWQGIEMENPHFLKTYEKRADELKAKKDRCLRKARKVDVLDDKGNAVNHYFLPSRRWQKYDNALKKLYQKRRDQSKVFLYTVAHQLVKQFDAIGIGSYTPQGGGITTAMRRAMNNRSLIGRFKEIVAHVALKSGKTAIVYDETGTTRTCHACNYVIEGGIAPNIREWTCVGCNTIHDRDENAAMNGLRQVLRDLATKISEQQCSPVPSSGLVQATERWAWRVLPSGLVTTLRGTKQRVHSAAPRNSNESVVAFNQKLIRCASCA